ncbi:MAG TPA: M20/M25/M40 family metallo-hydrolase [Thermoanaerobaculia bacterium]|nr:M20/M25/M40 family metallo-hydrolase [Thermoanaerobaculia bacterium]
MDLFELTRALIDIDSVTGRERAVGDFLYSRLAPLAARTGGQVERMPVEADRFNLFASWGQPEVVLSTHMDTVPPFFPSADDGDHIRGRGACDTKGGIAAMVKACEELAEAGTRGFGLLLVVGEETDSIGATVANRNPRGARYLINGEPTENRLAIGSKGALYLEVKARGRMAHSAYPELGESAIDKLLGALQRLKAVPLPFDPVLGETTLNVGTLSGGRAPNVVADRARAEVMIRTVGDTEELKRRLVAAVTANGTEGEDGARVAEVREVPAMRMGTLPGFETTVVKYTSDVPRLGAWGKPYMLGPGTIHVAHTSEERVAKAELVAAARLYREMVQRLQAGGR